MEHDDRERPGHNASRQPKDSRSLEDLDGGHDKRTQQAERDSQRDKVVRQLENDLPRPDSKNSRPTQESDQQERDPEAGSHAVLIWRPAKESLGARRSATSARRRSSGCSRTTLGRGGFSPVRELRYQLAL